MQVSEVFTSPTISGNFGATEANIFNLEIWKKEDDTESLILQAGGNWFPLWETGSLVGYA